MTRRDWRVFNPGGSRRVVVTKELPGDRWLELLTAADCRVEIAQGDDILPTAEIVAAFGDHVDAAIGQLTEGWSAASLRASRAAGAPSTASTPWATTMSTSRPRRASGCRSATRPAC